MRKIAVSCLGLLLYTIGQSAALAQYGGGSSNVCVVEVTSKDGQSIGTAGKGFAARVASRDVFLTTAHGISQLMRASPDPRTMFNNVGSIVFRDFANRELGTAGACISKSCNLNGYTGDLLAFDMPSGSKLQTLALASTLPAVGTRVWVLSKVGSNFGQSAAVDRFQGTVVQSFPNALTVRLNSPLNALHSSGSPVVNDRNEVVGMLCGTGDGRSIVGCNPCVSIYQSLTGAPPAASSTSTRASGRTSAPATQSNHGVQTYR